MRSMMIIAMVLVLASPVSGHHSDAALDTDSVVTIEGTVAEFSWQNPHIYFTVETTDERGEPIEWTVQMASTVSVSRMGWTPETLSIGDQVSVGAHPARDGRPYGLFDSIEKAGLALPTSFDSETGELRFAVTEVTASPTGMEGRWMSDGSAVVSYVGGYDGYTRTHMKLTEKAAVEQAAYDEASGENPELRCMGRPTPALIFYSDLFPMEIEFNETEKFILIRGQFFDEERAVYMDGRGHPEGQRFHGGHSIGHWEGGTLVVDTRNLPRIDRRTRTVSPRASRSTSWNGIGCRLTVRRYSSSSCSRTPSTSRRL